MFLGQLTDTAGAGPSTGNPQTYVNDETETLPGSDSQVESGDTKPTIAPDSAGTNNTLLLLLGAAAVYYFFIKSKK